MTSSRARGTVPDAVLGTARTTRRGGRLGITDNGTLALATSAVTLYWLMPALLGGGRRRRPRRRTRRL